MTLPESQWSKDNPGPPPIKHVPLVVRVQRAIDKALVNHKAKNAVAPMTPDEKKLRAKELRDAATELERK